MGEWPISTNEEGDDIFEQVLRVIQDLDFGMQARIDLKVAGSLSQDGTLS